MKIVFFLGISSLLCAIIATDPALPPSEKKGNKIVALFCYFAMLGFLIFTDL